MSQGWGVQGGCLLLTSDQKGEGEELWGWAKEAGHRPGRHGNEGTDSGPN